VLDRLRGVFELKLHQASMQYNIKHTVKILFKRNLEKIRGCRVRVINVGLNHRKASKFDSRGYILHLSFSVSEVEFGLKLYR
jgi:hypothetical protein